MNSGQKCPLWFAQGMKLKISYIVLAFQLYKFCNVKVVSTLLDFPFFLLYNKKERRKKKEERRKKGIRKDELEDVRI